MGVAIFLPRKPIVTSVCPCAQSSQAQIADLKSLRKCVCSLLPVDSPLRQSPCHIRSGECPTLPYSALLCPILVQTVSSFGCMRGYDCRRGYFHKLFNIFVEKLLVDSDQIRYRETWSGAIFNSRLILTSRATVCQLLWMRSASARANIGGIRLGRYLVV